MDAPPTAPLRLFLGLWPAADTLAALERHAADWSWPAPARRTPPERMHITLHFLGDVPAGRLPALRKGLDLAWKGCELALDRLEVWPGGIAVLEAASVPPRLARLHAALGEQLLALGVPVEARRYRPHVTLARKASGAQPPAGFQPLQWIAEPGYRLVRSLPGGRGYEPLAHFG